MTADGVAQHVSSTNWGPTVGTAFWYMTLFCGFLVLAPSMASTIDGIVRRWVDVFWTSSARLRQWETQAGFATCISTCSRATRCSGWSMLAWGKPVQLLIVASNILNFALGFSCFHVLVVNCTLLPRPLRPHWFMRVALALAGIVLPGAGDRCKHLKTIGSLAIAGRRTRLGSLPPLDRRVESTSCEKRRLPGIAS